MGRRRRAAAVLPPAGPRRAWSKLPPRRAARGMRRARLARRPPLAPLAPPCPPRRPQRASRQPPSSPSFGQGSPGTSRRDRPYAAPCGDAWAARDSRRRRSSDPCRQSSRLPAGGATGATLPASDGRTAHSMTPRQRRRLQRPSTASRAAAAPRTACRRRRRSGRRGVRRRGCAAS
eukprot:366167-Chlamydomonas_euryale.AAC.5